MERAQSLQVRDTLRSFLYMRMLGRACDAAEAIVADHEHLAQEPGMVVRSLERQWAARLDDFVAPLVSSALAPIQPQEHDRAASVQLYKQLFLCPDRQGLTPWCRKLPKTHPFMFELMSRFLDNAVHNLQLCMQRLGKDHPHLSSLLGCKPGNLQEIQPTASDGHCKGQGVLILQFDSGTKLVYKPFGAEPARLAAEFFKLLNAQPSLRAAPIPCVQVVVPEQGASSDCNNYHWSQFIENAPCSAEQEVELFYRKAGALTAAAALLGFGDGHFENLIASRNSPFIVDYEACFQPAKIANSVGFIHILLTSLVQEEPRVFSPAFGAWEAGFQHPPEYFASFHAVATLHERTHRMQCVYDVGGSQQSQAVPTLHGTPKLLKDYVPSFEQGFRCACQAAQELSESSFQQDLASVLHQCRHCLVRLIPRPTSLYVRCLRLLQQPSALESSDVAEATLQQVLSLQGDKLSGLHQSELEDLLQFDVPTFYIIAQQPSLLLDSKGRQIHAELLDHIHAWSPEGILDGSSARSLEQALPLLVPLLTKDPTKDMVTDDLSCLEGAMSIASEVISSIFSATASRVPAHDLYSGLPGILVYLAGIQKHNPGNDVISRACHRLVGTIVSKHRASEAHDGCCGGAFCGPASDVYGLALAGVLTSNPEWVEAAAELYIAKITLAAADHALDVISGMSGCVLVGIALHASLCKMLPSSNAQLLPRVRDIILRCGSILLDGLMWSEGAIVGWRQSPKDTHGSPWSTQTTCLLPGFSHGLSGAVLALRRLFAFTGDNVFLDCAYKAAAAEDTMYNSQLRAWVPSPLHDPHASKHASCFAWCWGLPGIALSRRVCCSAPELPLPSASTIDVAALLDMSSSISSSDDPVSLCCGLVGRIDVALALRSGAGGGGVQYCPELKSVVSELLKEFAKNGSRMFGHGPGRLGLMQGISGLGYVLLRSTDPVVCPCVLSLDI